VLTFTRRFEICVFSRCLHSSISSLFSEGRGSVSLEIKKSRNFTLVESVYKDDDALKYLV